jgi:hypothetical protein
MSFLGNMVALADSLTQSFALQADVIYYAYASADGAGKPVYALPVVRRALYTRKMKQVRTFSGEMAMSTAQVVFLTPTVINEFDKIVTPVGGMLDHSAAARDAAQPILGTDAFVDASNAPILTEIYLG